MKKKKFLSLAILLLISFLGLTQTACNNTLSANQKHGLKPEDGTNNSQPEQPIGQSHTPQNLQPDNRSFTITLTEDKSEKAKVNNYFNLTITPRDDSEMDLNDLYITGSVSPNQGTLKKKIDQGNSYTVLEGKKKKEEQKLTQLTCRLQYTPDKKATTSGTNYTLTVTIRHGNTIQTETCTFSKK